MRGGQQSLAFIMKKTQLIGNYRLAVQKKKYYLSIFGWRAKCLLLNLVEK